MLLDQVREVLTEYKAHLPLSIRQVFYRLVGVHGLSRRLGPLLRDLDGAP